MDDSLASGAFRVYCLGITLDTLTLAADILTVAVIEPDLYDQLFADAVDTNTEGTIPAHAVPFEATRLTSCVTQAASHPAQPPHCT